MPNNACLAVARFGPLWHWLDVPRHLNFFTTASLTDLFASASLTPEDVAYTGYCRQFSAGWKDVQSRIAETFDMARDRRVAGASYWAYLAQTALARPERKYDSVRLVGRLAQAPKR